MDENTLFLAFIGFAIFLTIFVLIIRKISVQDIGKQDNSSISFPKSSAFIKPKKETVSPDSLQANIGQMADKKTLNKIGKVLGVLGGIIIFAPLPQSFNGIGIALVIVGYFLSKVTEKSKKSR